MYRYLFFPSRYFFVSEFSINLIPISYRQDLANIVRRRGYKVIKDLLETSAKSDKKESDTESGLSGKQDISVECEYDSSHSTAGQVCFSNFLAIQFDSI